MIAEKLWGNNAKLSTLLFAASILILGMLGGRELWTQEHRWADIVAGMFYRHDFLHPYLGNNYYYDKPLLSYWLIAAVSYLNGQLSIWTLRLPSAIAGIISVWAMYRIGVEACGRKVGLLSGWMLLTTFYFVFWAKTSSADALNLAGILLAVAWYFEHTEKTNFLNYAIFFLILAVTSLFKGLTGAIVPLITITPHLLMTGSWKKHLNVTFLLSLIPALIIYVLPFWLSTHFGGENYHENGLYLVYRENILRYFQPFDHRGPVYTYLIFLPVYLVPWAIFLVPALGSLRNRWSAYNPVMKSLCWALLLLFLFFTLSGSRRNYYVLPLVPFALLMIADWIIENKKTLLAGKVAVIFFCLLFINFDVIQPLYNANGGVRAFAKNLQRQLKATNNNFVLLDPESKVRFYMNLPPVLKNIEPVEDSQTGKRSWPYFTTHKPQGIFITRKMYAEEVKPYLSGYKMVTAKPTLGERLLGINNLNAPVAFIPETL